MVCLLTMVIFYGYVSHNQMVPVGLFDDFHPDPYYCCHLFHPHFELFIASKILISLD